MKMIPSAVWPLAHALKVAVRTLLSPASCLLLVLFSFAFVSASAEVITFEDLPDTYFFASGDQNIGSFYAGLRFGPSVTALSVSRFGGEADAAYPSHSGDVVVWSAADPEVNLSFGTPLSSVGVWYTSFDPVILSAFDANFSPLGTVTGSANTDGVTGVSSFISVAGTGIRSVTVSSSPGLFTLDDLTTSSTPEPSTAAQIGIGMALACLTLGLARGRRRAHALAYALLLCASGIKIRAQTYTCDSTIYPNSSSWPPAPKVTAFNLPYDVTAGKDFTAYIGLDSSVDSFCTLSLAVYLSDPIIKAPTHQVVQQGGGFYTWSAQPVQAVLPVQVNLYGAQGEMLTARTTVVPSGSPPPPPPTPPTLAGITVSPSIILGGKSANATVSLTSSATGSGLLVMLASDNPTVSLPSSVLITPGLTFTTIPVATPPVSAATTIRITASYGSISRTAELKLLNVADVPSYEVIDLGNRFFATSVTEPYDGGIGAVVGETNDDS